MTDETPSANPLHSMIESQKVFTSGWVDFDRLQHDEDYLQYWALDTINHIIEEAVELRRELPNRKYWKKQSNKPLDFEKLHSEYSDLVHFLLNLGLILGLKTADDFYKCYDKKHQIVLERERNGY